MRILLKTKGYIVVHKMSGQDYQEIAGTLKEMTDQEVFPVHRLDKETCGVMLFALNKQRASDFVRQFKEKKIKKTYLALVSGMPPEGLLINRPLKKNKSSETEFAQTKIDVLSRRDITRVGDIALLKCEPLTGRYHQIRRHLKMIDCPIIGDEDYGISEVNKYFQEKFRVNRVLLSAVKIEFIDPIMRNKQAVRTMPDPDFLKVLKNFEFKFKI